MCQISDATLSPRLHYMTVGARDVFLVGVGGGGGGGGGSTLE